MRIASSGHVFLAALIAVMACHAGQRASPRNPRHFPAPAHITLVGQADVQLTSGDSIQLRATPAVHADTLRIRVSVRNIGTRAVHLEWGACSMRLQLFGSAARAGVPLFDDFERDTPMNPSPGLGRICPMYLAYHDLAPGDTIAPGEFIIGTTADAIAGDSLPPGRYYLTAEPKFAGGGSQGIKLRVPAGVIQLSR